MFLYLTYCIWILILTITYSLDITKYRYESQKGCPVVYKVDRKDLEKFLAKNMLCLD